MAARPSTRGPGPADVPANPWLRYGIEGRPERQLRLGLIVDRSGELPRWAEHSVKRLVASGLAKIVLILEPGSATTRRSRAGVLRHLAWSLARATLWRTAAEDRVSSTGLFSGVAVVRGVAEAELGRIRETNLDVVLEIGGGAVDPRLEPVSRYGAWWLQFGDDRPGRGSAAGFQEVRDGVSEILVTLRRGRAGRDGSEILGGARLPVDPGSYGGTLERLYRAGADLPLEVCRDLAAGLPLQVEVALPIRTERDLPGIAAVARVLASTMAARARRLVYGAFVLKQWSVGRLDGGAARVLSGHLDGATWLHPTTRTRILADPMIVPGTRGRVVLCEAMDYAVGRGGIARLEVGGGEGGTTPEPIASSGPEPITDLDFHLSFPVVVSTADGLLMVPEAAQSGGLLMARLDDRAASIVELEVAPGLPAVDPVVFVHEGRWWLACTEHGRTASSHLWLFHGSGPRGPWTAHARNPVVIDAASARAAGLPFIHAGTLYRPAQDGRAGYGRSIRVMRVVQLTPVDYVEELAAEIGPDPAGPYPRGVHTVSVDGDTIWIDGYRTIVHPLAGWYRLRARRAAPRIAARRVSGWPA